MNLQRALSLGQDILLNITPKLSGMILPKNVVTVLVNFRGLCDFWGDYMLTPSQANLKFLQFGV